MSEVYPTIPGHAAPTMDIVIACCRDEIDIITSFIDFYFDQEFDRIYLIDNGSVDGTIEKILSHPRRDHIFLLRDSRHGYDMRLLEYYNMFVSSETRWVFFIDIDEFVPLPGGIKAFAQEVPPQVTLLELPTAEMQPILDVAEEMSALRSSRREARFAKDGVDLRQLELKVVWKAGDVKTIYCGKHDIVIEPRIVHRDDRVYIRHFHTRSKQQFLRKIANRVQTEEAMGAKADSLTLFSPETRRGWLAQSYRLLEPDGWRFEAERLAGLKTVADPAIADWYRARAGTMDHLDIGPIIPLHGACDGWFCTCVRGFRVSEGHTGSEHLVLFYAPGQTVGLLTGQGMFAKHAVVPVRLHSECVLGDIFSSNRCDCGYQLASAIEVIKETGGGVIIYLRQEGRGIGLFGKMRSLTVDHDDTFHRNEALGFPGDARGYRMAGEVLQRLGVTKARLLSGNGAKANALRAAGIDTVLEPRLSLDRIAPEAVNEIRAKLKKGYAYELISTATIVGRDDDRPV